jgi:hypothetical protein
MRRLGQDARSYNSTLHSSGLKPHLLLLSLSNSTLECIICNLCQPYIVELLCRSAYDTPPHNNTTTCPRPYPTKTSPRVTLVQRTLRRQLHVGHQYRPSFHNFHPALPSYARPHPAHATRETLGSAPSEDPRTPTCISPIHSRLLQPNTSHPSWVSLPRPTHYLRRVLHPEFRHFAPQLEASEPRSRRHSHPYAASRGEVSHSGA